MAWACNWQSGAGIGSGTIEPGERPVFSAGVAGSTFWQQGAWRLGAGWEFAGSVSAAQQQQLLLAVRNEKRQQQAWGGTIKVAKATKAHTLDHDRGMTISPSSLSSPCYRMSDFHYYTAMTTARLDRPTLFISGAFWLLLLLVTLAFLRPEPITIRDELMPEEARFHAAKLFHALGYAFLTILGTMAWPGRGRWVALGLVAHGAMIEIIQPHVGRHGTVTDVGIDAAGVTLGWLACRFIPFRGPAT